MKWGYAWRALAIIGTTATLMRFSAGTFEGGRNIGIAATVVAIIAGFALHHYTPTTKWCHTCAGATAPTSSRYLHMLLRMMCRKSPERTCLSEPRSYREALRRYIERERHRENTLNADASIARAVHGNVRLPKRVK